MSHTKVLSRSFVSLLLLAASAQAQVPFYVGNLLLQPGLNTAQCLTAASNTNGAAVTLQPCSSANSAAQNWVFSGGSVTLFGGSMCLDVTNGNTADGTKLQIWACGGPSNANQQFFYTGDYRLAWTNKGKCMDVTDGNAIAGNPIQMWACIGGSANQVWNTGYLSTALPNQSQDGQFGTNNCGTGSNQNSQCQNLWLNSAQDFCVWGPPNPDSTIGDSEREQVAWCTKAGRGTRVIPNGTFTGVHFLKTPDYVQVTGTGDFTKINIQAGDAGGEMDGHGADGKGNPIGGLLFGDTFGQGLQYHEWTNFMGADEFCIRACKGPNAAQNCQHIYDIMGCFWNIPANYSPGFENCDADDDLPMGVYGTSTWFQGVNPTPPAHPAASSSNCVALPTITAGPL